MERHSKAKKILIFRYKSIKLYIYWITYVKIPLNIIKTLIIQTSEGPINGEFNSQIKKLVGFVATATLATSMIAGASNASAQTTSTLKASEPVQEKAKDKKEERPESLFPSMDINYDTTIYVGDPFDPMAGVSAYDSKDGDITDKINIVGEVDPFEPGTYNLDYTVANSRGFSVIKQVSVWVKRGEKPILRLPYKVSINVGDNFDPMAGVSATDEEDGDITSKIKVDGNVDTSKPGTYELTYTVSDSKGHTVSAKQTVTVKQTVVPKDEAPVLTVPTEVTIHVGDKYNPLSGVKAIDKEDGDITDKVIHMGEVDTSKAGNFEVKFLVRDASGNEVTATQKVIVKDKDTENGSDNNNNNTNSGNSSDNSNNNTNSGNVSDNTNTSSNNNTISNLDNKKETIKELPKTGASSNNGTAVGILAILAGMLITFDRKFKKAIK